MDKTVDTDLVLAAMSMGYRKQVSPQGRTHWCKPLGYTALIIEEDLKRISQWFLGATEKDLCLWNQYNFNHEESFLAQIMYFECWEIKHPLEAGSGQFHFLSIEETVAYQMEATPAQPLGEG